MGFNFGFSPSFTAMVFSYPGTSSSSSSKSLCSGRMKTEPKFIAAARGKSSQNHHFLWVSEVTLRIFGVRFGGASPSFTAMVFSHLGTGNSSQNHDFLWVSEVTLGIFGVQFWGFSVLHCHGVFPSGDQQQQQHKPLQQQEESSQNS